MFGREVRLCEKSSKKGVNGVTEAGSLRAYQPAYWERDTTTVARAIRQQYHSMTVARWHDSGKAAWQWQDGMI